MKNKNIKKSFIVSALVLCMLIVTGIAGKGVYAATQNNLQATDSISFIADPFVDAIITQGDSTFVFTSKLNSDDNQTGTIDDIDQVAWLDNTETSDNDQDKYATISFIIKNTSDIDTNELTYKVENDFNSLYADCILTNVEGILKKDEEANIEAKFIVDGIHDIDIDTSWTITLTASK